VQHFGDTAFIPALDLVMRSAPPIDALASTGSVTVPEFRWPIGADRSPWFPAARLFRRAHTRDWSAVGDALAVQLRERLAAGVDADLPGYRRLLVP
jgi:hypothetical protein